MLYPAINDLINDKCNRYALVVGVAKKAREIAKEAYEEGVILEEKPVKISIELLAKKDYSIHAENDDINRREIIQKILEMKEEKNHQSHDEDEISE